MKVKLLKDTAFRKAGEILDVDSGSAARMVESGKAELVEGDDVVSTARAAERRGNVSTVQVADADPYPGDVAPQEDAAGTDDPAPAAQPQPQSIESAQTVDRDKQVQAIVDQSKKSDLVAAAVQNLGMSQADAAKKSERELAELLVDKMRSQ